MKTFRKNIFLLVLLIVLSIFFLASLSLREYRASLVSEEIVYDYVEASTKRRSAEVKRHFKNAEIRINSIRSSILNLVAAGVYTRELAYDILKDNLDSLNDARSIWIYLEPDAFDDDSEQLFQPGRTVGGRFGPWIYYNEEDIYTEGVCVNDGRDFYQLPKKHKNTMLTEPYVGSTVDAQSKKRLWVSMGTPIIYEGKFKGAAGIDWFWYCFNDLIVHSSEFDNSSTFLVSSKGEILAHARQDSLGKTVSKEVLAHIGRTIQEQKIVVQKETLDGQTIYRVTSLFEIPYTEHPWVLVTEIPENSDAFSLLKALRKNWILSILLISVLGFLILSVLVLFILQLKEKSKIQQKLTTSENKISSIMQSKDNISIYALDKEFRYTNFNSVHKKIMMDVFKTNVGVGESMLSSLPDNLYEYALKAFERAIKGEHFVLEGKYRGRNFDQIFSPIYDGKYKVIGLTCKVIDVTDMTKANDELTKYRTSLEEMVKLRTEEIQAQKNFIQGIIDENPNSIIVKDFEGRYVLTNTPFLSLFQKTEHEIIEKTIDDLDVEEKVKTYFKQMDERLLKTKEPISFESSITHPSNEDQKIWFTGRKTIVTLLDKEYIMTVMSDITERKGYEESLSSANVELTKTIDKLTNAQLQLVEQEKMATLGQLSSGLAHEINNPLNFIAGSIAPLQRDIEDIVPIFDFLVKIKEGGGEIKDLHDYVDQIEPEILFPEMNRLIAGIKEGAKRVTEVIDNFREFSSSDREDRHDFNINKGLKLTLGLLRSSLGEKIKLTVDLDESLPKVFCDHSKINKVFLNIISNASQAIDDVGEIKVKSYGSEGFVYVLVSDNGRGMTEEEKMRIFDPFYGTKMVGEGIGMGMTISYRIIESHGGTINVDSARGKGTTVIVKLPVSS